METQVMFKPDSILERYYRIPKLIVTKKGTALLFCSEKLHTVSDEAKSDAVMRRSFDNGKTWGEREVVLSDPNEHINVGIKAAVANQETGEILLLCGRGIVILSEDIDRWMQINHKAKPKRYWPEGWNLENPEAADSLRKELAQGAESGRFLLVSTDEGNSWKEEALLINKPINPVTGDTMKFGPQFTGIQLQNGAHKGRLILPGRGYSRKGTQELYAFSHNIVFYSDDKGRTWNPGGLAQNGTGEACVVELSDGSIYLNSRNESLRSRGCRAYDISEDGGESFIHSGYDTTLVEPHCHASICRYSFPENGEKNIILFANPANKSNTSGHYDRYLRNRLTIRVSYDDGLTWPKSKLVNEGVSAYSFLAVTKDKTILLAYESSDRQNQPHGKIMMARMNLKWIESQK